MRSQPSIQRQELSNSMSHALRVLIYGLYEKEELIGVSIGRIKHWCRGTEYYIEELFIRNGFQGRGCGRAFFSLIEKELEKRDIHQIYLMTDRNQPAYGFYQTIGFTELPELTSFFKEFCHFTWFVLSSRGTYDCYDRDISRNQPCRRWCSDCRRHGGSRTIPHDPSR